ncbi:hypothetical protein VM95_07190 [Streptomyces rubellomurinus]|uniref:Uncharacterized protein n=1 Tax=Streptomyces rubellomurinus (strain ATCC 31215) TaxID=359131 RepID=A0A0F2TKD8_STRR3|nr:hypothetical protein VM95_07190 [Streptomyces rubellomurinus]
MLARAPGACGGAAAAGACASGDAHEVAGADAPAEVDGPGVPGVWPPAVGVGVGDGVLPAATVWSVMQPLPLSQVTRLPSNVATALCSWRSPLPSTVTENVTVALPPTGRSPVQVSFPS